jgi:nucleotide-binding universal stress UspA family protein
MYQKILVPLDGSELAECALNHVKKLFQSGPVGEVILLNAVVVDIPWRDVIEREDSHAVIFDYRRFIEAFMNQSKRYLAKVQARLASEGLKVATETIESNRPSETITDYAQKNGVDLILIATHGYTGMKKMMMGSVALQVLHGSNVPVLLIRPDACRTAG